MATASPSTATAAAPPAAPASVLMPQKKFFRSRAHCNPLSHNDAFDYPVDPSQYDWSPMYPELIRPPAGPSHHLSCKSITRC
jgi:hypothetical protein